MKKKYVAVMLGLVLSMSTASVYAAGSSAATAAESTDSSSDSSNSQQGEKPDGEPPAKPDGDNSEPPTGEKPDGEPPQGDGQGGPGGAPGGQSQGGDNSSFYGVGAAILATDGEAYVSNSTIDTDAKGAAGLFAYGDGTVYAANDTITLSDVDITYADDNDFFLKCTGNSNQRGWGESGNNGADCLFTAIKQEMQGDVVWDSISQLDFYMTDGSTLTGAVTDDESNAGEGRDGYCNLYIGEDCTWTVTGDSTLTSLSNSGTIVDADGNTVTVKGTDGTVYVEGESSYTVTVDSYSDNADKNYK